jgi:hypothetical protein
MPTMKTLSQSPSTVFPLPPNLDSFALQPSEDYDKISKYGKALQIASVYLRLSLSSI